MKSSNWSSRVKKVKHMWIYKAPNSKKIWIVTNVVGQLFMDGIRWQDRWHLYMHSPRIEFVDYKQFKSATHCLLLLELLKTSHRQQCIPQGLKRYTSYWKSYKSLWKDITRPKVSPSTADHNQLLKCKDCLQWPKHSNFGLDQELHLKSRIKTCLETIQMNPRTVDLIMLWPKTRIFQERRLWQLVL